MAKIYLLALCLILYFSGSKATGTSNNIGTILIPVRPGRLTVIPEVAQLCENVNHTVVQAKEIRIKKAGPTKFIVNVDGTLLRPINKIKKTVVHFQTCADNTRATCQHFTTWVFGDESCALMEKRDSFWSPIFNNVEPELHCPIAEGEYHMRNGTIDLRRLENVPFMEKYFWRAQLEAYDHEFLICAEAGARFIRTII